MHSRDEPFLRSLECYFGIYFPRCFATREINTKITLSWALKRLVTRVHTLYSMNKTGFCYPTGTKEKAHQRLKAHFICITVTSKCAWWHLNHLRVDYLLNRLFRRRWKKTSKLRVTGLCTGNSPVTGEFPVQRAWNAGTVSISWPDCKVWNKTQLFQSW